MMLKQKEPVNNEYFSRVTHKNCIMINLNENLFSFDRHSVRENFNRFILSDQRGKALTSVYQDFFNDAEFDYKIIILTYIMNY